MTRGIAYLKAKLPLDGTPTLELSYEQSPITQDLGDNGLCVAYLEDAGSHYRYLTPKDRGDLDQAEFHARCVENLAEIAREKLTIREYNGIYVALMGGDFEASLILVDAMWDQGISHLAPNGFVAALPARDILAFCDSQSEDGLAELEQVVARLQASPDADHLLHPDLLRREGQRWVRMG